MEMENKENNSKSQSLEAQLAEVTENWKRAVADYRNLEKRVEAEKEALIQFASQLLVIRLLPIMDNLLRAQTASPSEGLSLVIGDFKKLLQEEGVEEIEAEGQVFDPQYHEAVEAVIGEEGRVVEVVEKGYKIKGQVIRPAKVRVGQKPETPSQDSG